MEAVILGIGMALFGLVASELFRRWSRNKQRQVLVLFGFAAAAAVLLAAGLLLALRTPKEAPEVSGYTETRVFSPIRSGGELLAGFTVDETNPGSCWEHSLMTSSRPDALRCTFRLSKTRSLIEDPCFYGSYGVRDVFCFDSPWDTTAIAIEIRHQGSPCPECPPPPSASSKVPMPWALELANGARCTATPGTQPVPAGRRENFDCGDGQVVIGDLQKTPAGWTATFGAPEVDAQLIPVHVSIIWI
jgi:hypothetical protein